MLPPPRPRSRCNHQPEQDATRLTRLLGPWSVWEQAVGREALREAAFELVEGGVAKLLDAAAERRHSGKKGARLGRYNYRPIDTPATVAIQ